MNVTERLFVLQDKEYAEFQGRLIPNIGRETILGVRVPEARKLAKELMHTPEGKAFLKKLPHSYYDENILHSLMLSEIKDYNDCIRSVDFFLPFIDNWAVCDVLSPKVFKKHREVFIHKVKEWIASDLEYTSRFGLEMLMSHYLEEDFHPMYLELATEVKSEKYYINMMIAWFFATALAKRWEETVVYLEGEKLSSWVHNKTIQKAIESRRITKHQKEYLRGLRK